MTTRARAPRLPRNRQAPGQLSLDGALLRAQRRYPEALRIVPSRTGTPLVVLAGGAPEPTPIVAVARKVAAA